MGSDGEVERDSLGCSAMGFAQDGAGSGVRATVDSGSDGAGVRHTIEPSMDPEVIRASCTDPNCS